MVSWYKKKEAGYADVAGYTFATCFIFYLLMRHYLLSSCRLQPTALGWGACFKAWRECVQESLGKKKKKKVGPKVKLGRTQKDNAFHLYLIWMCTYGCLCFYLVLSMSSWIMDSSETWVGWLPFVYCHYAATFNLLLIIFAKVQMYFVFIARLHIAFFGSAMAYSIRLIYALYASVVICTSIVVVMVVAFYRGEREEYHTADGSKLHFCVTDAPAFLYMFSTAYDVFINVALVYLFASALRKTFKLQTQHVDEKRLEEVRHQHASTRLLPLKYTVLSTASVLTTFITVWIYGTTGFQGFFAWDFALNSFSLVLMTSKWAPVYSLICTPVIRCVARTPCLPNDLTQADLIEVVVRKQLSDAQTASGVQSNSSQQVSGSGTGTDTLVSI